MRCVEEVLVLLQKISNPVEKAASIRHVADQLGLDEKVLLERYRAMARPRSASSLGKAASSLEQTTTSQLPKDEEVLLQLLLHEKCTFEMVAQLAAEDFTDTRARYLVLLAQSAVEPSMVARGQTVFTQNCSVGYCHGVGGAAGRGPRLRGRNLPKDYLDRVTREGIPSSAMPAWKGRLSEDDIRAVVEYVAVLSAATDAPPPMQPMPAGEGPATARTFSARTSMEQT